MHDIKWIVNNWTEFADRLKARQALEGLDQVQSLNETRKRVQHEFDELRAEQNRASQDIAALKKSGQSADAVMARMKQVSERTKQLQTELSETEVKLEAVLLTVPNLPHASVPIGRDAADNPEVRRVGTPRAFDFTVRDHVALGEALGLMDFERAAKVSGARFVFLTGALARLERALAQFMLAHHTARGYTEVSAPLLVNADTLKGTGQLPKFEDDLFKTMPGLYLIPTAEVPVTNLFRGEILEQSTLPQKFCAWTACFRSEAGSHGRDVRGMIRQHQFYKVELVKLATEDNSYQELEGMVADAESVLTALGLPFRTVTLCTGDMGFGAAKTYDIEVWLPSQNAYREISSCSNCEAFQARRMNTRYRDANGKLKYVHTLNGSGLAVGRTLIAVLENYQQADGTIAVPEVLRPFMGCSVIGKGTVSDTK